MKSINVPLHQEIDYLLLPAPRFFPESAHGMRIWPADFRMFLDNLVKSPTINARSHDDPHVPMVGGGNDFAHAGGAFRRGRAFDVLRPAPGCEQAIDIKNVVAMPMIQLERLDNAVDSQVVKGVRRSKRRGARGPSVSGNFLPGVRRQGRHSVGETVDDSFVFD